MNWIAAATRLPTLAYRIFAATLHPFADTDPTRGLIKYLSRVGSAQPTTGESGKT
jgi:hypothetical protein